MKYREMEIPERMKDLLMYQGVAVPYTTLVTDDGKIHFKSTDNEKNWEIKRDKKCAMCGKPLDYYIAFMVSEKEAESRIVYENPNHEECLRYAFNVCPWLFYSKARYTDASRIDIEGVRIVNAHPDRKIDDGNAQRPQKLGIYITRGYENIIHKKMYRVCKVAKPVRIEWIEGK